MPLLNFGIVLPGKLYRSGQPDLKGFSDLSTLGVTKIIKLDGDDEFPLIKEKEWFSKGEVLPYQLSFFYPDRDEVVGIANEVQRLIMCQDTIAVHCKHGRDRTGLVIGAWGLIYAGKSYEEVEKEFEDFGAVGIIKLADFEILSCLREIAKIYPTH